MRRRDARTERGAAGLPASGLAVPGENTYICRRPYNIQHATRMERQDTQEALPAKRGRGRPPGSKNKGPKKPGDRRKGGNNKYGVTGRKPDFPHIHEGPTAVIAIRVPEVTKARYRGLLDKGEDIIPRIEALIDEAALPYGL